MTNDKIRVKVTAPSDVGTKDILTVALSALGVVVENCKIATPIIVAKKTSAGVGKSEDDKVSISGSNLVINEGATGFAAGDIWYVDLVLGDIPSATATASATPT